MENPSQFALFASGVFFLIGLLTGVWKYLATWRSPQAVAPRYVNVAHQASLMYAFATLLLLHLVDVSPFSATVNWIAVASPVFFFLLAVTTYLVHATLNDTDNAFRRPYRMGSLRLAPPLFHLTIWLLILGEIGGFAVLFAGFLLRP